MAGVLTHVTARLRSAEVLDDPFPHFYAENIFPDDYYDALLRHLPDSGVYQNLYEVTDLKLDHFRHRDQRDFKDGWTERLPPPQKAFWEEFHDWFLSAELAQAALESFASQIGERRPAVSVESQLIRHRAGYFLGPHSDANTKLVVLLLYLAPHDRAEHLGTSLYRPKDPAFGCPHSRHYPFEEFVKVKTAPYRPNSVLAFFRSDQSFHGVEPLSESDVLAAGGRDLIQYVVYDRDAREAQLRARQEKTA